MRQPHVKARQRPHARETCPLIENELRLAAADECLRAAPEAWRWPDEQDHARPYGRQGKGGLERPRRAEAEAVP